MNDNPETDFFHKIAPAVIALVIKSGKKMTIATSKAVAGDYATQVDVDVENLIVSELEKYFPKDQVLAEEGFAETKISSGRIWIIDPICGTSNLGKGINNFCTNIALAENEKVVAACVVDHSQGEYIWSVGEGKVFVDDDLYTPPAENLGQKIDIDFGALKKADERLRQKHNNCLRKLIEQTDFDLISLNASLGFAYVAIGKTDGFINVFNHPWDIAAAGFLIQQAGGVITGIDGSEWVVTEPGAIAGRTSGIHAKLLELF